jgi:hypothetical protein
MTHDAKPNARPLATIARDIRSLERRNIFGVGRLLIEAKESCEHGDWLSWFKTSAFSFKQATAERYMSAARLAAEFRTVRNLKLHPVTLYRLPAIHRDHHAIFPDLLDALAKASAKRILTVPEANAIIAEFVPPLLSPPDDAPSVVPDDGEAMPADLAKALAIVAQHAHGPVRFAITDKQEATLRTVSDFITKVLHHMSGLPPVKAVKARRVRRLEHSPSDS